MSAGQTCPQPCRCAEVAELIEALRSGQLTIAVPAATPAEARRTTKALGLDAGDAAALLDHLGIA